MQIQYRNEKVETKRVYYTGTDVLPQGAALCYDADYGTAASADNERAFRVEKPATANFHNFAGILTDQFAGVKGPAMVEIYVPTARGQKVTVRSGANNVIDSTLLRLKNGTYELDTDGTGPVVARAMQTVDHSAISGPVQALMTGPVAPVAEAAIADLVDNSGGSADNTIAAITNSANVGSADVGPTANAIADLAAKVNAILAALRGAGIIKP